MMANRLGKFGDWEIARRNYRKLAAWLALASVTTMLATIGGTKDAAAEACPSGPVSVNGAACTVTPGSTLIVTSAIVPSLSAVNPGASITAQGITVQLGPGAAPRNFVGAQALTGAAIELSGSTVITNQAGTGQRGVVVDGAGSQLTGVGLTITLGIGTTVSDNLAVLAQNGGFVSFTNTAVSTLGGVNGIANHALTATGAGSSISFSGGTVSTASRGSFGVLAANGGVVTIGGGAQVTTTYLR
ncbi:hypothetical protein [Rhizobium leguminosarum]|uniref:hypothetical protein n=1 Tax=Rhizobium leguminosarum TaxID=384 RepID=UPI001440F282|nr:hypothetical protein [Rhizobium leguminosarum]NKL77641.1 hypothetical protein [Rhizobium leguminosarum bv. viciae]